jgi:RNA polymerase sigma-70 factor (ECF subfamily)
MDESDIERLVLESRQGSKESFEKLLTIYEKPVFNAAYRILNDYEDARDVTQSVFLKAYENLDNFDRTHRFFSWIYRIAVNESINVRKAKRPLENLENGKIEEPYTPERALSRKELDEAVQTALMSLGMDYRIAIVLRHFLDCSYRDISEILEIPEKRVKSRLFTARNLLRESLSRKGAL